MHNAEAPSFRNQKAPWLRAVVPQFVAGMAAGVASTLLLHPLDFVKVAAQIHDGPLFSDGIGGVMRRLRTANLVDRRRGAFRSLYKGVGANVAASASSWGAYFALYALLRRAAGDRPDVGCSGGGGTRLSSSRIFGCSAAAGLLTCIATNPLWCIKTRIFLQPLGASPAGSRSLQYAGVFDAGRRIVRAEGVAALYRGLLPGIAAVSHGALQFVAYEALKRSISGDAPPATWHVLFCAAASKVAASTATYPTQLVRSRLQRQPDPGSIFRPRIVAMTREIWARDGLRGFYRGLVPNIARILPATCVTFVVYERVLRLLA